MTEQSAIGADRGRRQTKAGRKEEKERQTSKDDEVDQFLLGKTRTSSSEETDGLDQPDRCGGDPLDSARMRGAVSKSGVNASLAGEERRYGES